MTLSKKSLLILSFILACAWVFVFSVGIAARGGRVNNDILRLHILAADDSEEERALKLALRDYVLADVSSLIEAARDTWAAARLIQGDLPYIERRAQAFIADKGFDHDVSAAVAVLPFPAVSYNALTLPRGDYLALQISIGGGYGGNWWCVLFPGMCILDAEVQNGENRAILRPRLRFLNFFQK